MKHLVMFSGGVCSWAAGKRVVERHGADSVTLLFADTHMEDEDLYRFLDEAAANIGAPLVRISDGRTPWELMREERFMGNSRLDICSRVLKRELLDKWREEHCDPADTTIHLGLSWDEDHRVRRVKERFKPWVCECPMAEKPWVSKAQMFEALAKEGIEAPRLYKLGFAHNNCGGFCIKAGQAQFVHLLRTMPERYAFHEKQEEELRAIVGPHTVLSEIKDGEKRRLSLRTLRERIEAQGEFDELDWGGCGCAVE